MTKKHFIEFAKYIKLCGLPDNVRREMADMVVRVQDNPKFDRARFYSACGLNLNWHTHHTITSIWGRLYAINLVRPMTRLRWLRHKLGLPDNDTLRF